MLDNAFPNSQYHSFSWTAQCYEVGSAYLLEVPNITSHKPGTKKVAIAEPTGLSREGIN